MRAINQMAGKVFDALTEGMDKVGDHKKIEHEPYMPLSIEVIDSFGRDEGLMISFCHYGLQNGALCLHLPALRDEGKEFSDYPQDYAFAQGA